MLLGKKGIYIAPLAMAFIVILIIIIVLTMSPAAKQTVIDIVGAVTGHTNVTSP